MRLVLVHGINSESSSAAELQAVWLRALETAWSRLGLASLATCKTNVAYYADELARLSAKPRGAVAAGTGFATSQVEFELLQEYATAKGVTQQQIAAAAEEEGYDLTSIEAGVPHESWILAMSRALENILPSGGKYLARLFTRQASVYIERQGVQNKIKSIVRGIILEEDSPVVIIAHSLGTVISYEILSEEVALNARVPLFCTLGSPLAVGVVSNYLGKRNRFPRPPVQRWINAVQFEDFVTLGRSLVKSTIGFDGIENITQINNVKSDKHDICAYLSNDSVATAIHYALNK